MIKALISVRWYDCSGKHLGQRKKRGEDGKNTRSRVGKERGMASKKRGKNRLGWGRGGKRMGGRKQEGGGGIIVAKQQKERDVGWITGIRNLMLMATDEEDHSNWGKEQGFTSLCTISSKMFMFLPQDLVNQIISNANIRTICNSSLLKGVLCHLAYSQLWNMCLSTQLSPICYSVLVSSHWLQILFLKK